MTPEQIKKNGGVCHKQYALNMTDKAIDIENRTVKFAITTGGVDRDNDTVEPTGWEIASYLKNPSILWAHDYTQLPVAKALDITKTPTGLESTAQFPPKGTYPFADTVFELIQGGFLNATSVGFRPLSYEPNVERGGLDFKSQELLEYSIVPVPSNPGALIQARSKGIDLSPVKAWAEKALAACAGDGTAASTKGKCSDCGMEYDGDGGKCAKCSEKAADIQALIEKIGRVLSAANEDRLRSAREALDMVLSQLEKEPVADEKAADEDSIVFTLLEEETLGRADIEAALRDGIRATLASLVRDEVGVALTRARGRID